MGRTAILLIGNLTHVRKEWNDCAGFAELMEFEGKTREEFVRACEDGSYNDVVGIYRSNESTSVHHPFHDETSSPLSVVSLFNG